jgi:predicted O-linked N-acetylglucosamine transferase (SPINDLY family)
LLRSNEWAEVNLRREAEARGVDPDRLIFAGALPHAEHLGRLRHADLFLDTFNVNAHTTASDALWAGLPVLTRIGRQFAARVGASLVRAVGLPELAAESDAAYEALALELATTPALLAGLRTRLAANRQTAPLFDTKRYTRQLEAAFDAIAQRHAAGLPPDHIAVT